MNHQTYWRVSLAYCYEDTRPYKKSYKVFNKIRREQTGSSTTSDLSNIFILL